MSESNQPTTPPDDAKRIDLWIDKVAERFECARKRGEAPAIADFLENTHGVARRQLLLALIDIDVELRREAGEAPSAEEYAAWFPDLLNEQGVPCAELVACFRDDTEPSETESPNSALLVRFHCPNCGTPIRVVETKPRLVECPSCGSSCRVDASGPVALAKELPRPLGKFELLELLGQGAFGAVYKARDTELNRLVAIKVPRSGNFATQAEEQRFWQEARSAAKLRHERIVQVHEISQADETTFIVVEFIDGVTLAEVAQSRSFSWQDAAEIVAEIADALQYAHQQGVVHRDIKPSNILMDQHNRPHVADFGLALEQGNEIAVTVTGQVLGSPAYMSPEQARGQAHRVDGRTDVYSLGVVLYELLTGSRPFDAKSSHMIVQRVINDEPKPPRQLNDRIPKDLETICLKCLEKEPSRRYSSAGQLADRLRSVQRGETIPDRPVSRLEKIWRWAKRNPQLAVAGATATVLLVALSIVSVAVAVRERFHAREVANYSAKVKEEKELTDQANTNLQNTANVLAETNRGRQQALRQGALLALDRAVATSNEGKVGEGLLWFARSLQIAADDDPQAREIEEAARLNFAAWSRRFALPYRTLAHDKLVNEAAMSPDGRFVALLHDGIVDIWDVEQSITVHQGIAKDVTIGPTGLHSSASQVIRFSPDGNRVAVQIVKFKEEVQHGAVLIWNKDTQRTVRCQIEPLLPYSFSFKNESREVSIQFGRTWLTASGVKSERCDATFDVATGALISKSEIQSTSRDRLFNSPTPVMSRSTADLTGSVTVYGPWKIDIRLHGSSNTIRTDNDARAIAAIRPDGETIATTGDRTFQLWKNPSGEALFNLGATGGIESWLEFTPDGELLLADTMARTGAWSPRTGEPVGPSLVLHPEHEYYFGMRFGGFSKDGRRFITFGANRGVCVCDLDQLAPLARRVRRECRVRNSAFSPDGRFLGIPGASLENNRIEPASIVSADTLRPVAEVPHADRIAFSAESRFVLTSPGGPRAIDHQVPDPQLVAMWTMPDVSPVDWTVQPTSKGHFRSLAVSRDAQMLAASSGRRITLWSVAKGKQLASTEIHPDEISGAVFSSNGQSLVTCCEDGIARVWSTKTGEPIRASEHVESLQTAVIVDGEAPLTLIASASAVVEWNDDGTVLPFGAEQWSGVGILAESGIVLMKKESKIRLYSAIDSSFLGQPLDTTDEKVGLLAFDRENRWALVNVGASPQLWYVDHGKAFPLSFPVDDADRVVRANFRYKDEIVFETAVGKLQSLCWKAPPEVPQPSAVVDDALDGVALPSGIDPYGTLLTTGQAPGVYPLASRHGRLLGIRDIPHARGTARVMFLALPDNAIGVRDAHLGTSSPILLLQADRLDDPMLAAAWIENGCVLVSRSGDKRFYWNSESRVFIGTDLPKFGNTAWFDDYRGYVRKRLPRNGRFSFEDQKLSFSTEYGGKPIGPAIDGTFRGFSPDGIVLLAERDQTVYLHPIPQVATASEATLQLTAEAISGKTLRESGEYVNLDDATWQEKKQQLYQALQSQFP